MICVRCNKEVGDKYGYIRINEIIPLYHCSRCTPLNKIPTTEMQRQCDDCIFEQKSPIEWCEYMHNKHEEKGPVVDHCYFCNPIDKNYPK